MDPILLPIAAADVANEFAQILQRTLGIYLDATVGFLTNRQRTEEQREHSLRLISTELGRAATEEEWLSRAFIYGDGDPRLSSTRPVHVGTIGDFLSRTARNGPGALFMAQVCLVSIAAAWNDHARQALATALGVEVASLSAPIFGDLTKLRNDIVHHRAIATARNSGRLEVMHPRTEGTPIEIRDDEFQAIVTALQTGLVDILRPFAVGDRSGALDSAE